MPELAGNNALQQSSRGHACSADLAGPSPAGAMPQTGPQSQPSLCYSPAGEAEIRRLYDESLSGLPFSHEARLVDTAGFGMAHVITCGPPRAPPLVVWHGMAMPGPFLLHDIFRPLAERYRLHLPDIPGQGQQAGLAVCMLASCMAWRCRAACRFHAPQAM